MNPQDEQTQAFPAAGSATELRCGACGAGLRPQDAFCTNCGTPSRRLESPTQVAPLIAPTQEAPMVTPPEVSPAVPPTQVTPMVAPLPESAPPPSSPAASPAAWTPPPQATSVYTPPAYQQPSGGQPYVRQASAGRQAYAAQPYATTYRPGPSFSALAPALLAGLLGAAALAAGLWTPILDALGVTASAWQEGFQYTGSDFSNWLAICDIAALVAAAGALLACAIRSARLLWFSGLIGVLAVAVALGWTLKKLSELPQESQSLIHLSWGWAVLGAGAALILVAAAIATVASRRYRPAQ